jgi:hypothetical protein
MTELEQELLSRLVAARWALPWQAALGVALVAGYWAWARAFYARVDPALRRAAGRRLGADVVWVHRHSAAYQTPLEIGHTRAWRWTWGIADERARTLGRDAAVLALDALLVRVLAGLPGPALLVWAFVGPGLLSAVVFLPACGVVLGLYGVFFTGRYAVARGA